jgi:hypothetical protein
VSANPPTKLIFERLTGAEDHALFCLYVYQDDPDNDLGKLTKQRFFSENKAYAEAAGELLDMTHPEERKP